VNLELQPVRDARLKAEQQEREKQERERVAQEEAAGVWTDPATGLMWTKKDNGGDVNWQQAADYCRNLHLAGHSDWRLPTIDELPGIYDVNVGGMHVKGSLQLSNWRVWSSSQGNTIEQVWYFDFSYGERSSTYFTNSAFDRALCVRRSGGEGDNQALKPAPTSTPANATKISISAGVAGGLLLQKTAPVYPPIALAARVSGTVVLQAIISKTGSVENIHVISGPAMLQQAAVDAVKTWRYRPYMIEGEPVEVETTVSVNFSLGR
jgi:TonB family protein